MSWGSVTVLFFLIIFLYEHLSNLVCYKRKIEKKGILFNFFNSLNSWLTWQNHMKIHHLKLFLVIQCLNCSVVTILPVNLLFFLCSWEQTTHRVLFQFSWKQWIQYHLTYNLLIIIVIQISRFLGNVLKNALQWFISSVS